ncbi:YybS family protein [Pseudalkalibacillus hwajinpoensis]|uniref:YybS family protein n=1 Tax=Guptibacillus hwajinpoensis TaxID=208199 RepID=UPI00325C1790
MKNQTVKQLVEGAALAAVFAVLFLISTYVPLLGSITLWTLPLPFILMIVRNGPGSGFVMWGVTIVIGFLVAGIPSLIATLTFGIGGLTAGYLYYLRKSALAVLIGSSVAYVVSLVLVFVSSILLIGQNPADLAMEMLNQSIRQAEYFSNMLGQESNQFEMLREQISVIRYLIPTALVMLGVVIALISQLISVPVLKRVGGFQPPVFKPIREWAFPKSFLWYYLVVTILMMVGLEEGSTAFVAAINVYSILNALIFVQGLAVIYFFSHQRRWPIVVPILLTFLGFAMTTFVVIIGIIDLGFELRRRMKS